MLAQVGRVLTFGSCRPGFDSLSDMNDFSASDSSSDFWRFSPSFLHGLLSLNLSFFALLIIFLKFYNVNGLPGLPLSLFAAFLLEPSSFLKMLFCVDDEAENASADFEFGR